MQTPLSVIIIQTIFTFLCTVTAIYMTAMYGRECRRASKLDEERTALLHRERIAHAQYERLLARYRTEMQVPTVTGVRLSPEFTTTTVTARSVREADAAVVEAARQEALRSRMPVRIAGNDTAPPADPVAEAADAEFADNWVDPEMIERLRADDD